MIFRNHLDTGFFATYSDITLSRYRDITTKRGPKMAYVDQEKKAAIVAQLKKAMPKGWKYSVAVSNHSTLVVTISAAPVDLLAEVARHTKYGNPVATGHAEINHYYLDEALDESLATFRAIVAACNAGNYDNSDSQTDYFDVGHYVKVQIGRWNKGFQKTPA